MRLTVHVYLCLCWRLAARGIRFPGYPYVRAYVRPCMTKDFLARYLTNRLREFYQIHKLCEFGDKMKSDYIFRSAGQRSRSQ